jgi:hypothetical protein
MLIVQRSALRSQSPFPAARYKFRKGYFSVPVHITFLQQDLKEQVCMAVPASPHFPASNFQQYKDAIADLVSTLLSCCRIKFIIAVQSSGNFSAA